MSQIESTTRSASPQHRLWPVAALILGVVFTPMFLAWAMSVMGR